jgi:hypothetical protein
VPPSAVRQGRGPRDGLLAGGGEAGREQSSLQQHARGRNSVQRREARGGGLLAGGGETGEGAAPCTDGREEMEGMVDTCWGEKAKRE